MKRNISFTVTTLTDDASSCTACPRDKVLRHKADVHVTDSNNIRFHGATCLASLPLFIQKLHDASVARSQRAQASATFWAN